MTLSFLPGRFLLVLPLLAVTATATAHHSPARYLTDQLVAVSGNVLRLDWKNPHVYLVVDDESGTEWQFEIGSTSNLSRIGWTRDSLVPGEKITVRAHPNRDPDKTHALFISAVSEKNQVFTAEASEQDSATDETKYSAIDLNGVWRGDPKLAFDFLFAMLDHPVTEKAVAAGAQYDESMDPITECITWPTPRLVAWSAFYLVELQIEEDRIYFKSEFDNQLRTIYMDGRQHPDSGERTSQGHSIGWWENDTLVVDTTRFADSISPVADGIPSGAKKHVIEKYTLSDDGSYAKVDIWVDDPEYQAEPFSTQLIWYYSPHLEMLGFECDPETSSRFAQ